MSEQPAPQKWIDVRNVTEKSADVYIYNTVGSTDSAAESIASIRSLNVETINVRINSPGGSVYGGFAIYNALKDAKSRVVVYVDGLAASIASVIAMAGKKIVMAQNAMMMIHLPSGAVSGSAEDLRSVAGALDKLGENIAEIYRARSGMKPADVAAIMSRDTWLTASECLARGLCTEIAPSKTINASAFNNVPADIAAILEKKFMATNDTTTAPVADVTATAPVAETFTAEVVTAKVQAAVEAAHSAAKVALDAAKADFTNQITAKNTEIAAKNTEIESLKNKLSAAEQMSAEKLGVPPVAHAAGNVVADESAKPTKPAEILAHYRTLKGDARTDYFAKHKDEIWTAHDQEMSGAR
jgi:ATP-dependent Clp endopeptidase proteolytic subunit ClpP